MVVMLDIDVIDYRYKPYLVPYKFSESSLKQTTRNEMSTEIYLIDRQSSNAQRSAKYGI